MQHSTPKTNLIRGAFWTVGTRWLVKALGFINTVIMARMLMPEDYGIVAMATLTIGFIQVFLDFGARVALLRKHEITTPEINSAWTLSFIQGLIATLLVVALAPSAAEFFEEPRLNTVLPILALSFVFTNAINIGATLALKEYNFNLDFKIQVTSKVAGVIVTILAGLAFGDYRALMLGVMTSYILPTLLSYYWHPYRPRWETSKIGEIWAITKWLMLANIGNYLLERIDQFAAGRISDTNGFGLYNVGSDLGQLPVAEVGPAMLRAILPVLSSIQDDLERMRNAVIKTISALNTIIWPIGIGFMAISNEATEIILGAKWIDATQYVAIFALVAVLKTTSAPARSFLIVLGHTRTQSLSVWFEFVGFVFSALILVPIFELLGLAYARAIAALIYTISTLITANHKCSLPLGRTIVTLLRPISGAILMALLVQKVVFNVGTPLTGMLVGISSGLIAYTIWSLVSWWLFGKPEGLESTILDKLTELTQTRKHEQRKFLDKATSKSKKIAVYGAEPENSKSHEVYYTVVRLLKQSRAYWRDAPSLRTGNYTCLDYRNYLSPSTINQGDLAIAQAVIGFIKKQIPETSIETIRWGNIDKYKPDWSDFVIAGGGYILINDSGNISPRLFNDIKFFKENGISPILFGIGINHPSTDSPNSDHLILSKQTEMGLRELLSISKAISVRDQYSKVILSNYTDKHVELIGDPALHLGHLHGITHTNHLSPPQKKHPIIGLNLNFHGPTSTKLLHNFLPILIKAIFAIRNQHNCSFVYFSHFDTDLVIPKLLANSGLKMRVIHGPPEILIRGYAEIDILIGGMLHSCILAHSVDTPAIALAYDIKHHGFMKLFNFETNCLSATELTASALIDRVRDLLSGQVNYNGAISLTRKNLQVTTENFVKMNFEKR